MYTAISIGVIVIAIAVAVFTVYMVIFFKSLIPLVKHADDTVKHVQSNINRLMAGVDVSLGEINRISSDIAVKMDRLDSSFEAVDSIGRGLTTASDTLQEKLEKSHGTWKDKLPEWISAGFSIYQGFDKLRKNDKIKSM
jgi:uncharacterized protein YoxC